MYWASIWQLHLLPTKLPNILHHRTYVQASILGMMCVSFQEFENSWLGLKPICILNGTDNVSKCAILLKEFTEHLRCESIHRVFWVKFQKIKVGQWLTDQVTKMLKKNIIEEKLLSTLQFKKLELYGTVNDPRCVNIWKLSPYSLLTFDKWPSFNWGSLITDQMTTLEAIIHHPLLLQSFSTLHIDKQQMLT